MKLAKSIGKWKFQNENLWNLIADSYSPWKSTYTKYKSFFKILMGTWQKIRFYSKKANKRTISRFSLVFLIFGRLLVKISKKEEHFSFILFPEESESAIRFQKFSFWNFHFPILFTNFTVREPSQEFWKLFFSFYNMIADGLCNNMALSHVF